MSRVKQVPLVYNLFPRLAGTMSDWIAHASRAAGMSFNWLYINSIHYPGFSGSLYAVKYHYRINPVFLPANSSGDGLKFLEQTLRKFQDMGLWPMMDLVINHTSRDCPLVREHPDWYVHDEHGEIASPFAGHLDDPEKITVWGDLAEINNDGSSDKANLWSYWAEMIRCYLQLGFKGFRCDAAYKIPAELWNYLIMEASAIDPEVLFFAETLGCAEGEALALRDAGLHYFFNSSKWWDFEQPWCLEQHEEFGKIAPSISFPETHDTTRLAADTGGNELVQRQRYAFAAVFSAGLMMPIGYEFGFQKKIDVVTTCPADWETPAFDLMNFIKSVNKFKLELPLLHGEGYIHVARNDADVLILERRAEEAPGQRGLVLVNKRWTGSLPVALDGMVDIKSRHRLYRLCYDDAFLSGESFLGQTIMLDPAEVVLLLET